MSMRERISVSEPQRKSDQVSFTEKHCKQKQSCTCCLHDSEKQHKYSDNPLSATSETGSRCVCVEVKAVRVRVKVRNGG